MNVRVADPSIYTPTVATVGCIILLFFASVPAQADQRRAELKPNQSLTRAITQNASPRYAAALRLAQRGLTLMDAREYDRAVIYLEKALALDGNAYFHFYLARGHYYLGSYSLSLEFLEVAEPWLSEQPRWMAELTSLRRRASAQLASEVQSSPVKLAAKK